jgi:serine/threonine-protein kinase
MIAPHGARDIQVGALVAATYRITGLLGRGGMGAVWAAEHVRLPGKRVAIKVLHGEIGQDAEAVHRFRREAEITSRLGHPHIVQILDFNSFADGSPYLVLEYLEGESLESRIGRGRMPLPEVQRILRQIGSALQAAHCAQVIHRDLKPQNVFLCQDLGDGPVAKVLDFGISKIRGSQTVRTQDSAILGTPQYMAPEQALGKHDAVDQRTDVFALGTIVYEMLCGTPAFAGQTIPEVMFKVVYGEVPPLVEQAPGLPVELAQVVHRALAKKPEERFADVAGLVAAFTGAPLPANASRAAAATPGIDGTGTGTATSVLPVATARTLATGVPAPGRPGAVHAGAPDTGPHDRGSAAATARTLATAPPTGPGWPESPAVLPAATARTLAAAGLTAGEPAVVPTGAHASAARPGGESTGAAATARTVAASDERFAGPAPAHAPLTAASEPAHPPAQTDATRRAGPTGAAATARTVAASDERFAGPAPAHAPLTAASEPAHPPAQTDATRRAAPADAAVAPPHPERPAATGAHGTPPIPGAAPGAGPASTEETRSADANVPVVHQVSAAPSRTSRQRAGLRPALITLPVLLTGLAVLLLARGAPRRDARSIAIGHRSADRPAAGAAPQGAAPDAATPRPQAASAMPPGPAGRGVLAAASRSETVVAAAQRTPPRAPAQRPAAPPTPPTGEAPAPPRVAPRPGRAAGPRAADAGGPWRKFMAQLPEAARSDLREAEAALRAGHAARALHLAQRAQRHGAEVASALITMTHCARQDLGNARANLHDVPRILRRYVVTACRNYGIDLR